MTISTPSHQQSVVLDSYCKPVVRVLGLYEIPGADDLVAIVSRIGRAYGCEEVESPVLLQAMAAQQ